MIFSGTFFETPKEQRQKRMTFKCHCLACKNDYPLMKGLPTASISIPMQIINGVMKSFKFDRKMARANWKCVIDFLQNNDESMPCIELANVFRYYANIVKVIYCKEVCFEMHVNPVTALTEISPYLHKRSDKTSLF